MATIFDGLITSKTRIRVLMRLFLNPEREAFVRELADEVSSSPAGVSEELKQLAGSGLLKSRRAGRLLKYRADTSHPLFPELHSMVRKALGMDRILDSIVQRLGQLEAAFLLGDYAEGKDTGVIELGLVGKIDRVALSDLVAKTESYIGRKIRTLVLTPGEYAQVRPALDERPQLWIWKKGTSIDSAQQSDI